MPTPKRSGLLTIPFGSKSRQILAIGVNMLQRGVNKLCVTFDSCFVGTT